MRSMMLTLTVFDGVDVIAGLPGVAGPRCRGGGRWGGDVPEERGIRDGMGVDGHDDAVMVGKVDAS